MWLNGLIKAITGIKTVALLLSATFLVSLFLFLRGGGGVVELKYRARIFKLLSSPGIDFKESISPA